MKRGKNVYFISFALLLCTQNDGLFWITKLDEQLKWCFFFSVEEKWRFYSLDNWKGTATTTNHKREREEKREREREHKKRTHRFLRWWSFIKRQKKTFVRIISRMSSRWHTAHTGTHENNIKNLSRHHRKSIDQVIFLMRFPWKFPSFRCLFCDTIWNYVCYSFNVQHGENGRSDWRQANRIKEQREKTKEKINVRLANRLTRMSFKLTEHFFHSSPLPFRFRFCLLTANRANILYFFFSFRP